MLEMRAAVTHLDRIGHADPRERGALEGDGVGGGIPGIRVHVEIDQRAGAIFHRGETLIEITCCREAFTPIPPASARRSVHAPRSVQRISGTSSQCS